MRTRNAVRFAVLAALLVLPSSASAIVQINEVNSQGNDGDWFELYNTGPLAVDISGWVVRDNNDAPAQAYTVPNGTTLAAGAVFSDYAPLGLAFGGNDSVRLYDSNGTQYDQFDWTTHSGTTYGRFPNGTGSFITTAAPTKGTINGGPADPWPGAADVATVDAAGAFAGNLSGLAYQPSGTSAPGVLWAVRNGPSRLYRLLWNGSTWTPDTANGWAGGKTLVFPAGGVPDAAGVPDAEGVTLAAGDPNGIYVSIERNDDAGQQNTSRTSVLRYDTSTAATTLAATREWRITDIPGLDANAGFEAVTWIADSALVAKGFEDEALNKAYDPADYPNHGAGLFFAGVEQSGVVIAYALNTVDGTFDRVALITTGFDGVMDLTYEEETGRLWVACDDTCEGMTKRFDVATSGPDDGRFVATDTYRRPTNAPNLNNEGFAIAPQAECVAGVKPVFYADDSSTGGHALRAGRIRCTTLPDTGGQNGTTTTPPTPPATTPAPTVLTPRPPVLPARDTTKPKVSGLAASRRSVTFTLSEAAKVTITVEKRSGRKYRKVKTFTVNGKRGKQTVKLSPKVAAAKIRRGKLRIGLRAKDAAGNSSSVARKTVG